VKKRSVSISGHRTSFALEDEFFSELKSIAAEKNLSIAALVNEIDKRPGENLSSKIRLFILAELKSSALA